MTLVHSPGFAEDTNQFVCLFVLMLFCSLFFLLADPVGCDRWFKRADAGGVEFEPAEADPLPTEGAVPLETKAGTLVLLHHVA